MAAYYSFNQSNVSARECFRAQNVGFGRFLAFLVRKLCGIPRRIPRGYPSLDELPAVSGDEVPPALKKACGAIAEECVPYQARLGSYYKLAPLAVPPSYGAVFTTGDRLVVLLVFHTGRAWPAITHACFSRLGDGRILATTTTPPFLGWLDDPPDWAVEYMDYGRFYAEDLLERQYGKIRGPGVEALPIEDGGQFWVELHNRFIEYQVRRGVFSRMPEDEVAAIRRLLPTRDSNDTESPSQE